MQCRFLREDEPGTAFTNNLTLLIFRIFMHIGTVSAVAI